MTETGTTELVGEPPTLSDSFPDRRFQLWEYRVSHGALLVRSPRGPDANATTNIDLVFTGVTYIACPRILRGLELAPATVVDAQRVGEGIGRVVAPDEVFVLLSAGARHLVVAASCSVSENVDDIFDSPFD